MEHNSPHVFVCARHIHDWFYIHCSEVFDSDKLPKVDIYKPVHFFIEEIYHVFKVLIFIIFLGETVCIGPFCKGF